MPRKTLDELVAFGGKHAERVLLEDKQDELIAIYHLCCPDGDRVIGCPWTKDSQKHRAIQMVKQIAREHHAFAVLFLAEAWTIKRKPEDWNYHEAPSKAADRQEIVFAVATDGFFSKAQVWNIERDNAGQTALVPQEGTMDGIVGRVLDGIIEVQGAGHA